MKPEQFGTEAFPLSCSGLHRVMECPLSAYVQADGEERESGEAADTGSLVHFAASMFHGKAKGDARLSLELMAAIQNRYPAGSTDDAALHFYHYSKDERNLKAKIILNETKVKFQLSPAGDDPTQAPIFVNGTLDQVRETDDGRLVLHDIKTGSALWGKQMLTHHALQLAAYMVGATQLLQRPVEQAAIIRTADYIKGGPVFWWTPYGLPQAAAMLYGLRQIVAQIRMGNIWITPGAACRFCPLGSPADCVPRLTGLGIKWQQ